MRWNDSLQLSKLKDNNLDPQRKGWGPGAEQVDHKPGMCSYNTEGQWHSGLYEYSQQNWGCGPSLYVAFVRPHVACCSSKLLSRKTALDYSIPQ